MLCNGDGYTIMKMGENVKKNNVRSMKLIMVMTIVYDGRYSLLYWCILAGSVA